MTINVRCEGSDTSAWRDVHDSRNRPQPGCNAGTVMRGRCPSCGRGQCRISLGGFYIAHKGPPGGPSLLCALQRSARISPTMSADVLRPLRGTCACFLAQSVDASPVAPVCGMPTNLCCAACAATCPPGSPSLAALRLLSGTALCAAPGPSRNSWHRRGDWPRDVFLCAGREPPPIADGDAPCAPPASSLIGPYVCAGSRHLWAYLMTRLLSRGVK